MKFGQLKEYNISNIFIEKYKNAQCTQNMLVKLFPDPCLKNRS